MSGGGQGKSNEFGLSSSLSRRRGPLPGKGKLVSMWPPRWGGGEPGRYIDGTWCVGDGCWIVRSGITGCELTGSLSQQPVSPPEHSPLFSPPAEASSSTTKIGPKLLHVGGGETWKWEGLGTQFISQYSIALFPSDVSVSGFKFLNNLHNKNTDNSVSLF
jgi:hypothetical protein